MIIKDNLIDVSRCAELQKLLWSIVPERRQWLEEKDVLAHYESGLKYINIDEMCAEEKEILHYVTEKFTGGILLA